MSDTEVDRIAAAAALEAFMIHDGLACARCGHQFGPGSASAPDGFSADGRQLFVCAASWGCMSSTEPSHLRMEGRAEFYRDERRVEAALEAMRARGELDARWYEM